MDISRIKTIKLPDTFPLAWINGQLPQWANWLFVILLAHSAASIVWQLLPGEPLPDAPATFRQTTPGPAAVSQPVIQDIASMRLFGTLQKDLPRPPPEQTVAPDTQLRLILKGVFASSSPRTAFAIIADRTGNDETYRIEDQIPGGAVLKEIHADRVILFHNNRFETLRLPQNQIESAGRTGRSSSQVSSLPNRRFSGAVNSVSSEGVAVLKNYRQKLMNDPQSVMSAVRAEPFRRSGKIEGYRIFPGRDKQLLQKVGLQPGDIVTNVNGIALDSPLKGLEIMQQLSTTSEVTVNVRRNGVNQTYVVPLN